MSSNSSDFFDSLLSQLGDEGKILDPFPPLCAGPRPSEGDATESCIHKLLA
jgi:hypothetical protein